MTIISKNTSNLSVNITPPTRHYLEEKKKEKKNKKGKKIKKKKAALESETNYIALNSWTLIIITVLSSCISVFQLQLGGHFLEGGNPARFTSVVL